MSISSYQKIQSEAYKLAKQNRRRIPIHPILELVCHSIALPLVTKEFMSEVMNRKIAASTHGRICDLYLRLSYA